MSSAFAQITPPVISRLQAPALTGKSFNSLLSLKYSRILYTPPLPGSTTVIHPAFYCSNLAFFCRQELKIEKMIKIPFRFRLGSVAYTDWLEQKPNATNPNR